MSSTGVEWVAAPVPESAAGLELAGRPAWLAPLLARRGVEDSPGAERFLKPSLDQLHDPFLLAGMEEAVARLLGARDRKETVAVVGDYDVDGISATALLLAVFNACGIAAKPILPHRLREGYGFQAVHVERARAQGCGLIVTADCGSSSAEAVERALAAGVGVIITDHHLPGCELPEGALHINPRQARCTYPFRDLAAVGLAFKLALALTQRCGKALDPAPLLRVACLGTIADLVPLHGENRVIAALGLKALAQARSHGLKALIEKSGMKPPFTAADVGFRIGPRINAAGRLHDPERALELLLSRDAGRAAALAAELDGWNRERQAAETKVVEEARRIFEARSPLPPVLVAWSESWHKGVVGVAAGRVAKDLHRPTVLLAVEGETATGSGRSVPGIELHGFLQAWKERMERFGGHAQAVGLTARTERLEELRREWEEAGSSWPEELLARRIEYELCLPPGEVSPELLAHLAALEPFGQGNSRPVLRTGPLRIEGEPRAFGNGHLSGRARGEDGAAVNFVGWRWGERAGSLRGRFEVLACVEDDTYRGGPVLRLVDSRPASSEISA
ncbi:MAG TPA: single-stranded-DNA-specific exonuclease RecJ [Thermoanaerobaculia bacterium]|nr:single-stranded-DNA-specific exonuclease RecJ [Thermoanaerobaculia bacterium]